MDQIKIGIFLKTLRKEKGLTQEQLAEKFNTTNRSVSRWENGVSIPDLSVLLEIADFYEIEIGEIIRGERKKCNSAIDNITEETKEEIIAVAEYAGLEKTAIRKKHKKRTVTIALILTVLFLLTGFVSNLFVGNPISYFLAKNSADTIVYKNKDFKDRGGYSVTNVYYDYVVGHYIAIAERNNIPDSRISINFGFLGNYIDDDSYAVLVNKKNIRERLNKEYSSLIQNTLSDTGSGYSDCLSLGEIQVDIEKYPLVETISLDEIYENEIFDFSEIGSRAGVITLQFNSGDLTESNVAKKILEMKEYFDSKEITFAAISVILTDMDPEKCDGKGCDGIGCEPFPYSEIFEDRLEERLADYIYQ